MPSNRRKDIIDCGIQSHVANVQFGGVFYVNTFCPKSILLRWFTFEAGGRHLASTAAYPIGLGLAVGKLLQKHMFLGSETLWRNPVHKTYFSRRYLSRKVHVCQQSRLTIVPHMSSQSSMQDVFVLWPGCKPLIWCCKEFNSYLRTLPKLQVSENLCPTRSILPHHPPEGRLCRNHCEGQWPYLSGYWWLL